MIRKIIFMFLFCASCIARNAFADGEVKSLKDFKYWDMGRVRQCDIYDAQTGRLKAKAFYTSDGSTIERIEKYDVHGNKLEAALYDANGNLRPGVDGWAAMRWRYDENSHLMIQVSYDEFGEPIERKFYSESGKLVMRLYRDDESVNPYVNAAMYTMLGGANIGYYDAGGTLKEVTRIVNE